MRLPNAHLTVVERETVTDYLLNPAHPDNGGKSAFFETLGFERSGWSRLARALRNLAETGDVAKIVESAHGTKCIVDGRVETPSGKSPMVRSVWIFDLRSIWIVDRGLEALRLVTACPYEDVDGHDW